MSPINTTGDQHVSEPQEANYDALAPKLAGAAARGLLEALLAARGYLLNARIDLETGAPKRTAIATIDGGLKLIGDALAKLEAA